MSKKKSNELMFLTTEIDLLETEIQHLSDQGNHATARELYEELLDKRRQLNTHPLTMQRERDKFYRKNARGLI